MANVEHGPQFYPGLIINTHPIVMGIEQVTSHKLGPRLFSVRNRKTYQRNV